jgi:hypothetical protein
MSSSIWMGLTPVPTILPRARWETMVGLGYTDIIDLNFFLVLVRDRMHGVLDSVSGARQVQAQVDR